MYRRVGDAAKIFKVSSMTIKGWVDTFSVYFSENVNKSGGYSRFNTGDMRILALINEFTNEGQTPDEIRVALDNGQRGVIPDQPVLNVERDGRGSRVKELESELNQERYLHHKAQGKVDLLKEQLREANAEIARLNRLLGPEK